MLFCHHNILRKSRRNGFFDFARRFVTAFALALLLPVFASAFTVVMRDGRWIEIPDKFQVTQTALTYEAAPGLLVTLQLTSIDIAATDEANGSPQGALLRRIGQVEAQQFGTAEKHSVRRATRTLTNLDLEVVRRKRIESEEAYEIRRKEVGFPSLEELDRRRQEESKSARAMLAQSEIDRAGSEMYWRNRAAELRNEIFVINSEINYARTRLAESNGSASYDSFATFGSVVPYGYFRGGVSGPPVGNQVGIVRAGQRALGTVGGSTAQVNGGFHLNRTNRFGSRAFGGTYFYNYNSYDRSSILGRLNELEAARSGLEAQWQILEDEARRAGAQPGWLRR